jgi:glycosyltransferase involved in cell wall biosynthesis
VVLLEQLLAPVPGGTGRYAGELATALAQTAPEGSSITGWTAWHGREARACIPVQVPGLDAVRTLPLGPRALARAWQHGWGPAPRSADLVHAPTVLIPPRRRGQRLVVTVHDAVPWTHPETLTAHGARWHRDMIKRAARLADAIVVPTRAVAAELAPYLPGAPLQVIGEGVTSAIVTAPADHAARAERLGLPPRFALCVGTVEPRKGLDVAAAATADPGWPDLPLLIVGPDGWGSVRISGRDDRVRLLGRLSDADLAVGLGRATVVLVPSRQEGFGLPVIEAFAHGVPVVISAVPALVEVAAGAAQIVPIGDAAALAAATRLLTTDETVRADRRAAGLRRAEDFTWQAAARSCWQLYGDITRGPRRAAPSAYA